MTEHRLGHHDDARLILESARKRADEELRDAARVTWEQWLTTAAHGGGEKIDSMSQRRNLTFGKHGAKLRILLHDEVRSTSCLK